MKAVILIGGKGFRLLPLTSARPKAIVPFLSRPFLATQFELLRGAGIRDIILCLGHLRRRIRPTFGDGSSLGVSLEYAVEPEPLGTGGALGRLRSRLSGPFVCMNGDVLVDLDFRALLETHRGSGAALTLTVTGVEEGAAYGRVRSERREGFRQVVAFAEKTPDPGPADISAGVYVMRPEVLDFIPLRGAASLEHEVFPAVIASELPVAAHRHRGYFRDIGTLGQYRRAHRDLLDGKVRIPGIGAPNPGGVIVETSATVHSRARLVGPAYIGPEAVVREEARIGPYAVLGNRVRVEPFARVEDTILWADTRVSEGAQVSRSVIANRGFIGPEARVRRVVLGEGSTVARSSRIPWRD